MNYEDYYKQIASVYDPQRQLIQQQLTALPNQFNLQKTALEQAKINAFRDIANQSSARGAGWSGFRPGEEARYTGATYLPALANLASQQTAQQTSLQEALNKIGLQQAQEARGYYETQKQRDWQTQQDIAQRNFQAQQAKADRAFQASENAKSRAASRSGGPSITEQIALAKYEAANQAAKQKKQDISNAKADLNAKVGKDKKVSPNTYANVKRQWIDAGYTGKEFDSLFEIYRNKNNPYYELTGK